MLDGFQVGADFDEDGDVDDDDLTKWKLGFGTAIGATHMQGDANGDGRVDGGDILAWQQQKNSPAASGVPEPAAAWLAVLAAAAFEEEFRSEAGG